MFEREISRLRSLYHQQQQQAHALVCSNSRDLDAQFANLSQKHKDPNWGRDALKHKDRDTCDINTSSRFPSQGVCSLSAFAGATASPRAADQENLHPNLASSPPPRCTTPNGWGCCSAAASHHQGGLRCGRRTSRQRSLYQGTLAVCIGHTFLLSLFHIYLQLMWLVKYNFYFIKILKNCSFQIVLCCNW